MISYNENESETQNSFHGYNIKRPRPRYGQKNAKNKKNVLV